MDLIDFLERSSLDFSKVTAPMAPYFPPFIIGIEAAGVAAGEEQKEASATDGREKHRSSASMKSGPTGAAVAEAVILGTEQGILRRSLAGESKNGRILRRGMHG